MKGLFPPRWLFSPFADLLKGGQNMGHSDSGEMTEIT
jgi:hypothetical protein